MTRGREGRTGHAAADFELGVWSVRDETPFSQRLNRIERLERIANRLDSRYRLPVVGLRFGWDSVIGLIPGIGDVAMALPSIFIFYEGVAMGAKKRTLTRIVANTALDAIAGSVPLVGDLFDVWFKSHRRNVALLRADLLRRSSRTRRKV